MTDLLLILTIILTILCLIGAAAVTLHTGRTAVFAKPPTLENGEKVRFSIMATVKRTESWPINGRVYVTDRRLLLQSLGFAAPASLRASEIRDIRVDERTTWPYARMRVIASYDGWDISIFDWGLSQLSFKAFQESIVELTHV
jgi:hypothetical protein